jgi:hypothetical protein
VPPTCRTHYGGILIALGRWEDAERELLAEYEELNIKTDNGQTLAGR